MARTKALLIKVLFTHVFEQSLGGQGRSKSEIKESGDFRNMEERIILLH